MGDPILIWDAKPIPAAWAGSPVRERTPAVSKLQLGAEIEIPVETARGDLKFRPGLRFTFSEATGAAFAGEKCVEPEAISRGRVDLGIEYRLWSSVALVVKSFCSGLGRNDHRICGASLDLRMEFKRGRVARRLERKSRGRSASCLRFRTAA